MHLKALLSFILLLALPEAVFAAPDDAPPEPTRYVQASDLGVSKRNPFALNFQPQFLAMPLRANPLVKRQTTCPPPSKACFEGCCDSGFVCGIFGGEQGCCPVGKTCGSVSGCQHATDVSCGTYCCPAGSVCAAGDTCLNSDTTQCDVGFSPCTEFSGCCPTGSECILPKNCNIPCTPRDPICGSGCCQRGYYCTSRQTCAKDDTGSFTTLLQPTTTDVPNGIPTPSETPIFSTSTEILDSPLTSSDNFLNGLTSTSTSTSTHTTPITTIRKSITSTTTLPVATRGAAPTMGAMLGGSFGMAAGVLGILAM